MKKIAVCNLKGGVGKTTTTVSLGYALNDMGYKVLLVDIDPQADLTSSFFNEDIELSILDVLLQSPSLDDKESKLVFLDKCIHTKNNIDILPSVPELSSLETRLGSQMSNQYTLREYLLKDMLDSLDGIYDYVLVDCPPSLNLLTINALTYADEIIIPTQAEFYSSAKINDILRLVNSLKKRINPTLYLNGVFITMFDKNVATNINVLNDIEKALGNVLYETKIRRSSALTTSSDKKISIFNYRKKSNGAEDYRKLCKEMIRRSEQNVKN